MSYLPDASFESFIAMELTAPKELWRRSGLHGFDVKDYAYIVDAPAAASTGRSAVFLAERYGGPGIGSNGGGVRCGNRGSYQVKGIGRNSLAGASTDFWHKHGASSLQDCIKEVIWGEILHKALPHGAVRAASVIATELTFEAIIEDTQEHVDVPRALLVRDLVVRPAHFMRSSYIDLGNPSEDQNVDLQRTALAVDSMKDFAIARLGNSSTRLELLAFIFLRAAEQLARARVLRIIHGSHIPSNYAIDGEWLDFGTVTAVSSYSPVIVAPGADDSWHQHRAMLESIDDLVFYVAKFTDEATRSEVSSVSKELKTKFDQRHKEATEKEFLKLAGFSDRQIKLIPQELKTNIFNAIGALLVNLHKERYFYYGDARHPMISSNNETDLNTILLKCSISSHREAASSSYRSDRALRLIGAVFDARELIVNSSNAGRADVELEIAIRCFLLNQSNDELHRFNLDNRIDRAVRERDDVSKLIDAIVKKWAWALDYENSRNICFNVDSTQTLLCLHEDIGLCAGDQKLAASQFVTGLNNSFGMAATLGSYLQSRASWN